jgi:ubiquinol-cytochrome c reductase cytochrome b subunit
MISLVRNVAHWFDDRTGARQLIQAALYEPVPGGARWRYVWGSTLVMAFLTQATTGMFLWLNYSPSTQTAWESVYFIQHDLTGGWWLRGIHHFMAHAMVILLVIHLVQVVVDGAYRAPRELNFVLGIGLMLVVLGLSLTGYLLPWDQKGYWATKVGTELSSQVPWAGVAIKKLAVGGSDYGHATLQRFFALHAGLLPGLLVLLLVLHLGLFRRHGLHARNPQDRTDALFWPDQVLKDSVAALLVLAAVLALTVYYGGAELAAPADPASPYAAARPETYFLFLFQFLKWFPGESEVWGAVIIPTLVLVLLLLMPWIGRTRMGHLLNVVVLFVLLGGAGLLTAQALHDDYFSAWHTASEAPNEEPAREEFLQRLDASKRFLQAREEAEYEADRVIELANSSRRIPSTGALTLVYDDPLLQGPKLFHRYCASCHNYQDLEAPDARTNIVNSAPTGPNLFGLGSRAWVAGLLDPDQVAGPHYFGYPESPFLDEDGMVTWVQENLGDVADDERAALKEQVAQVVAALSAESHLPGQQQLDRDEALLIATGKPLIAEEMGCTECHKYYDIDYDGGAPDLTGYMSQAWLLDFLRNPAADRFYGDENDRMPAFAAHQDPDMNQLDKKSLELIVDWLRGDWYRAQSLTR